MAEDIMISVGLEVENALQNLGNLTQSVQTTQASLQSQLSPQVNNLGTRLQGVGSTISGFGQKINDFVGNQAVQAFQKAGNAAKGFATECVNAAMKSEMEWNRYGALVNSNGGNWAQEEASVKKWASTFSNSMGRANGDTREAMMTLAQMGVTSSQMESSMKGVAAVAARTGMTEAEASNVVASALNGRGMQLAKLTGLRIEDYKTADGQIDRERLMNDLYNQNKDAIDEYANSTEAQVNRINNSWGSFKKQIGDALLPVVKIVADVMGAVAKWFADLPGPVKTFIAALLAIGAVVATVIGALAFIGPVLVSIGGVITAIGEAGSIIAFLTPALGGLGAGFGVLAGAIAPLIVPILAVVAALTALYFIGVQMGWWNDLSGMIQKFGEVLSVAAGYVMNFVSWFAKLFTDFPAAQEEFRSFVDNIGGYVLDGLGQLGGLISEALGNAWQSITDAADGLRDAVVQMITNALSNLGASVVPGGGLVEGILAVFLPLPTLLYGILMRIAPMAMQAFTMLRASVGNAVMLFVNYIVQRFRATINGVRAVFSLVVNAIRTRLNQARAIAGNLVSMIRNAILVRLTTIPAKIRTIFQRIVSFIRSRLENGARAAKQKAKEIYDNIVNKIKEIPQAVADEIGKIPGKIQSGLASAAAAALTGAKNIVANFLSGLQRASPGKIQRETVAEFSSLPGIVASQGVLTAKATRTAAEGIVNAWENNISPLSVPLEEQFDVFNPVNAIRGVGGSLNTAVAGLNLAQATSTGMNNTSWNTRNITNNNGENVEYHVANMHIDLNNLPSNEKERFYNMLSEISRGA